MVLQPKYFGNSIIDRWQSLKCFSSDGLLLAVSTWRMQKVTKTFSHKLLKVCKNTRKSWKMLGISFVHHSEVEGENSSLCMCERKAKGWDLSPWQSLWITQESSQFLFHNIFFLSFCFVVVWFCFVFLVKAAALHLQLVGHSHVFTTLSLLIKWTRNKKDQHACSVFEDMNKNMQSSWAERLQS